MYFPYLRGRQYELLALRELAQGGLIGKHITPIVEPIKITSTLKGTVNAFVERTLPFGLIFNPAVGELSKMMADDLLMPLMSDSVLPSVIMGKDTIEAMESLHHNGIEKQNVLAVMDKRTYLDLYRDLFNDTQPRYTLFPDERQIRRTIKANRVMFSNNFNKRDKNADYLMEEDEFYSDDHLHFEEEGFVGFGDYSVVGDEFVESGFAPYAVAIHIVYFEDDNSLWVRHFVSDSNDDISDVAGKFHEAVMKLLCWYEAGQSRQLTSALTTLLNHAKDGYYPGLPTIKKLSVMHHLELIGKYLDGGLG
jgi:hypothetical protein